MRLLITTLCTLLLAPCASAEIYKTVDANGNVVYTDVPPRSVEGKPVTVTPLNSYEPSQVPRNRSAAGTGSAGAMLDAHYYSVVQITDPTDDQAIRENAGNVVIAVMLSPALRGDHRLVLNLDEAPLEAEPEDGVFALTNLDRGTHIATAQVIDADGAIIAESAPVTFHVLRAAGGPPTPTPRPAT